MRLKAEQGGRKSTRILIWGLFFWLVSHTVAHARSISDSVVMAIGQHPDILRQVSRQEISRLGLQEIDSAFRPSISVALGVGQEHSDNTATRANSGSSEQLNRRESSVTLRQLLFDGFKTKWERQSQQSVLQSEKFVLKDVANQVAMAAVERHLALNEVNRVLSFNLENLEAHQEIAASIDTRARSGRDDLAKVNQIQARLALSLANVEAAKNKVLDANAAYEEVVGAPAEKALTLADPALAMPSSLEMFRDKVMAENPVIQAGRNEREAAQKNARATRSADYPRVFIESGASWNDNLDGVSGPNHDAFLMLRLQYDLYSGGAETARSRQAFLRHRQANEALRQAIRSTRRQAAEAWHRYQSASRRVEFLTEYADLAALTRAAYEKQFGIGQRSLVDLLDAENELLNARKELAVAETDLRLSKYLMLSLQGDLFSAFDIAPIPGVEE